MTGVSAIPAFALSTPSIADPHPDAELLALGRRFDELQAAVDAAERRSQALSLERERHTPPMPETLRFTKEDIGFPWCSPEGELYMTHEIEPLRRLRCVRCWYRRSDGARVTFRELEHDEPRVSIGHEPWPEAQARADAIVAAHDAWQAAQEEVKARFAPAEDQVEKEFDEAIDRKDEIANAILGTVPAGIDGLAVQARVMLTSIRTDYPAGVPEGEWETRRLQLLAQNVTRLGATSSVAA